MTSNEKAARLEALLGRMGDTTATSAERILERFPQHLRLTAEKCGIPRGLDDDVIQVLGPHLNKSDCSHLLDVLSETPGVKEIGCQLYLHDNLRNGLFSLWLQPERRESFAKIS